MPTLDLDSPAIRKLLHRKLAEILEEGSGERLERLEIPHIQKRPYSSTAFLAAHTDRDTRRLVLKRVVRHPLNEGLVEEPDQALVEFNVLSQLYPEFLTIERCSVPRPVAILPEIEAFVMEHVEGEILADKLNAIHYMANRKTFQRLKRDFHDCGRWVRHFQRFTGRSFSSSSVLENLVLRSDDRLRLIEESSDRRCPANVRRNAAAFIRRQAERLDGVDIAVSGRHGDFGPWNTLSCQEGVTVFDFFGFRRDPLCVDALSVLVFLEAASLGIANSASRTQALQESFLDGLGPLPELPQPLLLLAEAQQRILRLAAAVLSREGHIATRVEHSRSIRANVRWFLAPAERSTFWPTVVPGGFTSS